MMRAPFALLLATFAALLPAPALASPSFEADFVFGARSATTSGWSEIAVRIDNPDPKPWRGELELSLDEGSGARARPAVTAPFAVDAGSSAIVRLPVHARGYRVAQLLVAKGDRGEVLTKLEVPWIPSSGPILVDLLRGSRLGLALGERQLSLAYYDVRLGTGLAQPLTVTQPKWDKRSGDPILPFRAASVGSATAVLIGSDTLARLQGPELEALTGYVIAGGSLAIVVKRPEDLRHPTLEALTSGEAKVEGPPRKLLLAPVPRPELADNHLSPSSPGFAIPETAEESPVEDERPPYTPPSADALGGFVGYSGGKLRKSPFGASAPHGLGEVHLLAFDPSLPTNVEDAWVHDRIEGLVTHAWNRRAFIAFPHGLSGEYDGATFDVHRQLDPNESSRWLIIASGLGLLVYSVIVGPINFSRAAKRGEPLRALLVLPVFSFGAFALILGLGVVTKGREGRARHLTLIEAGAGMERATARRFRGFFLPRVHDLTIHTSSRESVVRLTSTDFATPQRLVVDRDGLRIADVAAMPWETIVAQEDGFASLGAGVSIIREGSNDAAVHNRTGRGLRAVIVHVPGEPSRYFARIGDGESVRASSGEAVSVHAGPTRAGDILVTPLELFSVGERLEEASRGLLDAWQALDAANGRTVDWFPEDRPVVLAQLDGGEGTTVDSSLKIESDRALLRVVGWGGTP